LHSLHERQDAANSPGSCYCVLFEGQPPSSENRENRLNEYTDAAVF
jgi:hypothetical protein